MTVGMKLDLSIFRSSEVLLLTLVVIALATATKLAGCGLAAAGMGRRKAIQVGVGMIPRGEVGIVVAQLGIAMAAVSGAIYGVVLAMSVITTLVAPPLIKLAFAGEQAEPRAGEYGPEFESGIG